MCKLKWICLLILQTSTSAILTHVEMGRDVPMVFMVSRVDHAQNLSLDHFANEVNVSFFLNFASIYIPLFDEYFIKNIL